MNCSLCKRPAPEDHEEMIDAGWIPNYYAGQREMPGPVCPECRDKHLRLGKDGEWETIAAPPESLPLELTPGWPRRSRPVWGVFFSVGQRGQDGRRPPHGANVATWSLSSRRLLMFSPTCGFIVLAVGSANRDET